MISQFSNLMVRTMSRNNMMTLHIHTLCNHSSKWPHAFSVVLVAPVTTHDNVNEHHSRQKVLYLGQPTPSRWLIVYYEKKGTSGSRFRPWTFGVRVEEIDRLLIITSLEVFPRRPTIAIYMVNNLLIRGSVSHYRSRSDILTDHSEKWRKTHLRKAEG